jgi:hypothetical protein
VPGEWAAVVSDLRALLSATQATLEGVEAEFGSGHRQPGRELPRREREGLASLCAALQAHLQSINNLLRKK